MTLSRLPRRLSALLTVAGCLVAACFARPAAGHGTPFSVGFDAQTGKLTVSPSVYRNFNTEELFVLLQAGMASNDGTPGWNRGATLPSGSQLSLRLTAPLVYWNPQTGAQDPLPIPQGRVSILGAGGTAEVAAASGQNPTGVSGTNPLFIDAFTSHHHVVWDILDPDASGLYGLWARLESTNPTAFAASPSDPFLVVLNWGIADSQTYNTGVDRLVAPVPEPATVAILAAAGLGWLGLRRLRR
ncbi:MAG: PEP-CTERM sorting domain-containing protein [Planctomycetia bacterium]|nr:PEP-CTERM sorting domain-containing protein [Planctomycetia bacterium]